MNSEPYSDKFQGDTGGFGLTPCMLGGFSFSPHQQTCIGKMRVFSSLCECNGMVPRWGHQSKNGLLTRDPNWKLVPVDQLSGCGHRNGLLAVEIGY